MKKIIKSVVIIATVLSIMFQSSYLSTIQASANDISRDQAIEQVKSLLNQTIYNGQCVGLIRKYFDILGSNCPPGNAVDFKWNTLPSGWQRLQGVQPQKGDILIYDKISYNPYGHVAIYESDYTTYHQNFNSHHYVERVTIKYDRLDVPYWGVIRPNFKDYEVNPDASWVQPIVSANQQTGEFEFTWPTIPHATHYYIQINNSNGVKITQQRINSPHFKINLAVKGTYTVFISANKGDYMSLSQKVAFHYRGTPSDIGNNKIVKIKKTSENKYMYVNSANNTLSMKALSSTDSEQAKYLFKLIKHADGSYMFQSIYDPSKVIDIHNNNSSDQTPVNIYQKHGGDNQRFWIFQSDFNGYTINKIGTNQVFDTSGNTLYTKEQSSYNNSNQYFVFEEDNTKVKSISVNPTNATISLGKQFKANIKSQPNYVNTNVTWRSSTPAVASVDANGNVTALHKGSTYIIARTPNGLESKCLVKVVEINATSIALNTKKATLSVGNSFTAQATIYPSNTSNKSVYWRSSTPSVASVDDNGHVKALRKGSTYIFAKSSNGLEKKILVNVVEIPVNRITMNIDKANLSIGKTFNSVARVYPANATYKNISFSTSNNKIIKVSSNGTVTAVGAGNAYVYARTSNKIVGKTLVQVYPNPSSIKILSSFETVKQGAVFQLSSTVYPTNAVKNVKYYTTNENIARVTSDGKVTAIGAGSTYLCVETHNGLVSKVLLKVVPFKQDQVFINNGMYTLLSPNREYALDIPGASDRPYTRAQVFQTNNSVAQNLYFVNRGNNIYTISPYYAQNMVLDVYHPNGVIKEGDKVDIYPYDEPEAQEWIITKLTNGNYIIRLRSNPSLVLTRGADYDSNGHSIYLGWYSEEYVQCQWYLNRK